jgi:ribose transport system substrate-binding protein
MLNMKSIILMFLLLLQMVYSGELKTIAFAQDTMANDFRREQVYEVRDAIAEHQELKFVYSNAEGHIALMIRQVETFISQKVDLLIIGTSDYNAIVPVVSKAYQSGIPVIILDRGIAGNNYTTFINSDNVKIGGLAAAYIAKRLNSKGKVLIFEGLPNADVTQLRTKGFLEEISKHKDIKIIKRTGNYLRRDAIMEMEKLLESGIHVDAIFSESDSMLSGVRSVLKRYGIDPASIIMVGCDYTSEAQEAIRKGEQSGSVLFPLGGNEAVVVARKILNGEIVPKHIEIPVKLVTQENVDEVAPVF